MISQPFSLCRRSIHAAGVFCPCLPGDLVTAKTEKLGAPIASPLTRWRRTCGIVMRRDGARLEYIDAPVPGVCSLCGFGFDQLPTEAVRTVDRGLLHVSCADDRADYSPRGGL